MISLTFSNNNIKNYPEMTTGREIAYSISPSLKRKALCITLNGKVYGLSEPLLFGGNIHINTWDDIDGKQTFWHSTSHVMAEAIQILFPNAIFTIGPAINNGFYYDIDFGKYPINQKDLISIENKMIELIRNGADFKSWKVKKSDALAYYRKKENPYKYELIEALADGEIIFYKQGSFVDLCRGPHLPNTSYIKAFKLLSIAGAYWRGNSKNPQLTRIYGISFPKKSFLTQFLFLQQEAKKREHKQLGQKLELFYIDPIVGSGLPMWLPNGTIIRRELETLLLQAYKKLGYKEVITPHIGQLGLYKISGHYPYYSESQFDPISKFNEEFLLKPMNCPHHHRIYASELRSFRQLPFRLAEFGTVYRYEKSGELNGLLRARSFTQDDAHIYCTQEQLEQEIHSCIDFARWLFELFNLKMKIHLSYRDDKTDKYSGSIKTWALAEKSIESVVKQIGLPYHIFYGEASFYGPKIDFHVNDALNRMWQLGTIQVDYIMPERFKLNYIGSDNQRHYPVIIHRALLGSFERFLAILIEHTAGNFPLWLSPVQVLLIPLNDYCIDHVKKISTMLNKHNIRVNIDERNEPMGLKIRQAELQKIPYIVVIGPKEIQNNLLSIRHRAQKEINTQSLEIFLNTLKNKIKNRIYEV